MQPNSSTNKILLLVEIFCFQINLKKAEQFIRNVLDKTFLPEARDFFSVKAASPHFWLSVEKIFFSYYRLMV